ncbi:MAG: YdiU family protein [Pseudomonadota bacterium]
MTFAFDNSYARELEGFYVPWKGDDVRAPELLFLNEALALNLGLDPAVLGGAAGAAIFAGKTPPEGADPLAQAYAGHQFGGFSPQLGDGRALLLGEVLDLSGKRWDIQLKGSGRTPFSRGGDGKAALGPVLREYLMAEAMQALGVPTTRALAAVTTGEQVYRETALPGAVLTRVASSHIRVGTFQFFAARGDTEKLRKLADYAITRHDPDLAEAEEPYLAFLCAVRDRQAALIAKWMQIGFIHGVMNTDNMSIAGETIDYGPCAFMDAYDPQTVFSSIDTGGRYAYGNQPLIAQWNLARLAEALLPLIDSDTDTAIARCTAEIEAFTTIYDQAWRTSMGAKLGLAEGDAQEGDRDLVQGFLDMLHQHKIDFTNGFRSLLTVVEEPDAVPQPLSQIDDFAAWREGWSARLERTSPQDAVARMTRANPLYIPRNHRVEQALEAANAGDFSPFTRLMDVLSDPFTRREGLEDYAQPAPESFGDFQTFCGT